MAFVVSCRERRQPHASLQGFDLNLKKVYVQLVDRFFNQLDKVQLKVHTHILGLNLLFNNLAHISWRF